MTKAQWEQVVKTAPKGATALEVISNGKTAVVPLKSAAKSLDGVDGTYRFGVLQGKAFVPFAGQKEGSVWAAKRAKKATKVAPEKPALVKEEKPAKPAKRVREVAPETLAKRQRMEVLKALWTAGNSSVFAAAESVAAAHKVSLDAVLVPARCAPAFWQKAGLTGSWKAPSAEEAAKYKSAAKSSRKSKLAELEARVTALEVALAAKK